jgi:hypothetical protein
MKTDVPELPARVPSKRHQIRRLLDLHIALWLASDDITDAERERLQAEKDRRKRERPAVHVGVIVSREGMTPEQREYVRGYVFTLAPTTIETADTGDEEGFRDLIRAATIIVAAPKSRQRSGAVWDAIAYARHRKVPVRIVYPDGSEEA